MSPKRIALAIAIMSFTFGFVVAFLVCVFLQEGPSSGQYIEEVGSIDIKTGEAHNWKEGVPIPDPPRVIKVYPQTEGT